MTVILLTKTPKKKKEKKTLVYFEPLHYLAWIRHYRHRRGAAMCVWWSCFLWLCARTGGQRQQLCRQQSLPRQRSFLWFRSLPSDD